MNVQLTNEDDYQRHHKASCRICGSDTDKIFVDLGMSPLCESFRTHDQLDSMEPYYPLKAFVCGSCFLVQLREYVSPTNIFQEYAYFSSYSASWLKHAELYCDMIVERLRLGADSLVVELASNDGYLLQYFKRLGIPVLGIEPAANVAKVAIDMGIDTRIDFFGLQLANTLNEGGQKADLIIGNNVLAQVPDLNDFVAGAKRLLKSNGVITLEFPHLARLMSENQFDTIYHEHFSYFSFLTIDELVQRHGLKLIDVEELSTHGGSLRAYLTHRESERLPSKAVAELLTREQKMGLRDISTYSNFCNQVRRTKRELLSFLISAKRDGKRICGYGAPGKGNTLLNYCGIGTDFLDFTVDRNPYKHGRYTPGMHVPIHPVEAIDAAKPDYVLILPWNIKDEIIDQMLHIRAWGGKFLVPIPDVAVINPAEVH